MEFSYIITFQQPARGLAHPATSTYAGVATLDTSKTRSQAYLEIYAKYAALMKTETGIASEPATLFFALDLNTLGA